jgi:hypothetical protein
MNQLVSMAGSSGPLERTKGARAMSDVKTGEVLRRPRGRPRKNPDSLCHDDKKRGSQTSHSPEHYAEIRYKRKLAGITHKQFRILADDAAEAERLLMPLINKATTAYHEASLSLQPQVREPDAEADPLDALGQDNRPQEPPTAFLLEIEAEAVPEPPAERKPIRERGKLTLKAFRK